MRNDPCSAALLVYRFRLLLTLVLPLLVGTLTPASAQRPEGPDVVQTWLREQVAQTGRIDRIEVATTSERTVETPDGQRRIAVEARMAGHPQPNTWTADVGAATVNGRPVTARQLEMLERRLDAFLPNTDARLNELLLPARLIERMRSLGTPQEEWHEGVRYLRLDAEPPAGPPGPRAGGPPPGRGGGPPGSPPGGPPRFRAQGMQGGALRQVTLWFDAERGHLARTHLVLRLPRGAALDVVTDYERIGGLDLPARRRVEGTAPMQRRLRSFTVGIQSDVRYQDYRFVYR